jgi:hypothetical protein
MLLERLTSLWRRLRAWLWDEWDKRDCARENEPAPILLLPAPPSPLLLPAPKLDVPPAAKRPRRKTARLKADVLDQLERYLVYIKRLRKWDPDGYATYRRLGAYLVDMDLQTQYARLEPAIVRSLPGFGAIAIGTSIDYERETDSVPPRFAYFTKLKRPGQGVEQLRDGTTYRMHVYWDDAKDKRLNRKRGYGVGSDFYVNVASDGMVRALRVLKSEAQMIRHRKRGGGTSTVMHQRWGIDVEMMVTPTIKITPAQRVQWLFVAFMNNWLANARQSMIRVTATKGNIVMPFVVDVLDTPNFFADREPVAGPKGQKQRIFHIVRAHKRTTKSGKGVAVHMHFAGLRNFTWNGYVINITVPGRDHLDINDCSLEFFEDMPEDQMTGMSTLADGAELLADHIGAPGKIRATRGGVSHGP